MKQSTLPRCHRWGWANLHVRTKSYGFIFDSSTGNINEPYAKLTPLTVINCRTLSMRRLMLNFLLTSRILLCERSNTRTLQTLSQDNWYEKVTSSATIKRFPSLTVSSFTSLSCSPWHRTKESYININSIIIKGVDRVRKPVTQQELMLLTSILTLNLFKPLDLADPWHGRQQRTILV